jgi:hypothetical protein
MGLAEELHTIADAINSGCVFHAAGVGAVEISTMRRWLSRFCSPERISACAGPKFSLRARFCRSREFLDRRKINLFRLTPFV